MKKSLCLIYFSLMILALPARAEVDRATRESAANGTLDFTRQLISVTTRLDKECSEGFAGNLLSQARAVFNRNFLGKEVDASVTVTDACRKAREDYKAVVSKIYKNIGRNFGEVLSGTGVDNQLDQTLACADLQSGKSRYPLLKRYRVTRTNDGSTYVAQFNLTFTAAPGVDVAEEIKMRGHVKKCLFNAGVLKDNTGQKLKLFLVEPNSTLSAGLSVVPITIHRNIRSNSANYDAEIGCSAVVHEVLHLTGLWDEYEEDAYSCRSLAESVMSDHFQYQPTEQGYLASRLANEGKGFPGFTPIANVLVSKSVDAEYTAIQKIDCREKGTSNYRQYSVSGKSVLYMEDGFGHTLQAPEFMQYVPSSELAPETAVKDKSFLLKLLNITPTEGWSCEFTTKENAAKVRGADLITKAIFPLRPAHFRKIVYPVCLEKNKNYDLCTKEAYQKLPKGAPCVAKHTAICQDEKFLD